MRVLMRLSVVVLLVAISSLIGYLVWRGGPVLGRSLFFADVPPLEAVLGMTPVWDGIWPACVGTFRLVVLTVCLAIVPGIGCGLYLAGYGEGAWQRRLSLLIDLLAGMPSIVMGLFGFMLVLLLRRTVAPQANTGLLLASACLALLVLPVLVASTREAVAAVPARLRLAASALGLSDSQILVYVCLPAATRGILGGVVLAVGRAAEDTAVILFTGVVANAGLPAGLLEPFEALSFSVYCVSSQYMDQRELLRGFGTAALLLGVSCLLQGGAQLIEAGFRRRWQGGR